jgi:hypothetical protein
LADISGQFQGSDHDLVLEFA